MPYFKGISLKLRAGGEIDPIMEHAPSRNVRLLHEGAMPALASDKSTTVTVFVPCIPQEGFSFRYIVYDMMPEPEYVVFRLYIDGEEASLWSTGAEQGYMGTMVRYPDTVEDQAKPKPTVIDKLATVFGQVIAPPHTLLEVVTYRVIKRPHRQFELHVEDSVLTPFASFRFFCFHPDVLAVVCPGIASNSNDESDEQADNGEYQLTRVPTPYPPCGTGDKSLVEKFKGAFKRS